MTFLAALKASLKKKPTLSVQQAVVRGLVTARIYEMLDNNGKTKADLARILKTSRAAITSMLGGDRNLTLNTITEIAWHFGKAPRMEFIDLGDGWEGRVYHLRGDSVTSDTGNIDEQVTIGADDIEITQAGRTGT
jgi:plasmid maintenance system antidote protein VapI